VAVRARQVTRRATSYAYQYRGGGGVQRLFTIPASEAATPNQARAFAESLRDQIRDGFDPLHNRKIGRERQQVEQRAGHTVGELCDAWLRVRTDKRSLRGDKSQIDVNVRPRFGVFRVDELTRKDIADAMREIGAATPYMANRFLSLMTSLLNFAGRGVSGFEGLGWLDPTTANIALGIRRFPEEQREQNLSPDELQRLLAAIDRQTGAAGKQIRLLLLTLARKSEVTGARWSEFSLETDPGTWTKPASRMKAEKPFACQS
jgi:integrase